MAVLLCSCPCMAMLSAQLTLYKSIYGTCSVTAAQSRDLASPIYGHVVALTGYTWPRDNISWYQNFPHRFQYFPTPSTKTFRQIGWFHYFPTRRTKTFQEIYHGTKTFLIGSITFHLTVPKLSNSHCQNFPNFLLFCMRKIVLQNWAEISQ